MPREPEAGQPAREGGRPSPVDRDPDVAVEVTYYTDPLCSWSWAFEAVWRRLRFEMGDRISWRYVLGGLLPDWRSFNDPLHSVSRPSQMGPLWYEVRHLTGMPVDERIWIEDPPGSSYPACVAVKAAGRQGAGAGEACLRRLREAVLLERRNVARHDVLSELAQELAPRLDPDRFLHDLQSEEALEAFREDLKDVAYRGMGRFPAFVLRGESGRAVALVGYRPYDLFREALAAVAPDLAPERTASDPLAYALSWGSITAAEVAEAVERPTAEVARELDAARGLVRDGQIYRIPVEVSPETRPGIR